MMEKSQESSPYIQDYMEGNTCFGCGKENPEGLQIKSYWEGEQCRCDYQADEKYQGWKGLLNGGILGTLIDCHCMGTAMSHAYQSENRAFGSEPIYMYATGTMSIRYIKPTPNGEKLRLIATVREVKGKKTTLDCEAWVGDTKTAQAEVIAIRVYNSAEAHGSNPFKPHS